MAITRLITKQTLILPQVIKRVQQLTGHRVRDPVISSATSVFHLYQALKTRPEPEKLADRLVQEHALQRLGCRRTGQDQASLETLLLW